MTNITKATTTVLEIRLLHECGVTVLRAPYFLVLNAGGKILVLETVHTFRQYGLLEFSEQFGAADNHPRLE